MLKKGEVSGTALEYSLPKARAYVAEREKDRDTIVLQRVEELQNEIAEAIKKCKKVDDLPGCKNDIE